MHVIMLGFHSYLKGWMLKIDMLKQLNHPNVIKYLGSFIANNELNIVLELASAGDLSRMNKNFKKNQKLIPEQIIWRYFVQLCRAVDHMHSRRVMHRDIKPANVFLTASLEVNLGDLGLARFFSSITTGDHSLVFVFQMAALHNPFYSEEINLMSLSQKIEPCDYPPLSKVRYSLKFRDLVSMCIRADPDQRSDISFVLLFSSQM